ncbi:MAG TPA: acyl--CoA ligase [Bacillales bacterium]|nr:acyl--CoA ligase [Bacillales bacterium]
MNIVKETHFGRELNVFKNRPKNLTELLSATIDKFPENEALVMGGVRLTYKEMYEKVENIAGNLQHLYDVGKGDRIALLLGNSIEFALLVFACARIGAIVVPLNTRLKSEELAFMLIQSETSILFVDDEFVNIAEKIKGNSATNLQYLFLINSEGSQYKDYIPFEVLEQKSTVANVIVGETDPLFIMYTSGTTGSPKGAIGNYLGAIHSSLNYEYILKTDQQTKTLIAVPLFHVTGLIGQLIHIVKVGGTSVIMRRFKTEEYIRLITEEEITFLFNVPTIYVMLTSHKDFEKYSYHFVKCIAYGGAPMSTETINAIQKYFINATLHNAYGATETHSPATIMPQDYSSDKLSSVGLPVPVAEMMVVNEFDKQCKPGEVGELLIKGPILIGGYWKNDEANKNSFFGDYWRSGDLALIDGDGFVYIMDRKKDMINRGGEKIFSIEVENVLYEHPKVLEAAVVGIPDEMWGEIVKAVIVPKKSVKIDAEDIKVFVSQKLADFKIPKVIEFVDELPRNPGGKILKHVLRSWAKKIY